MPEPVVPLGLLYLVSNTPDRHEKVLWDLCFERNPHHLLSRNITEFSPELIAFGIRNIQNNLYTGIADNLNYYQELLQTIRKFSNAKIVIGGSGFSVMPAELMERLKPDFGISGEGERSFCQLLEQIESENPDYATIANLYFYEKGEICHSPGKPGFLKLDTLKIPDRSFILNRYLEGSATLNFQTKRGCVLNCDYCTYPEIEGAVLRQRSAEKVAEEICDSLKAQPMARHFFIVDSVFNLPVNHAKEICRQLIRRENHIPWTCYVNPIRFDQELAFLMKEAGCEGIEIGTDSGVDSILKKMRKGFLLEDVRKLQTFCRNAGIKDCHTFILGTPGESLEETAQTIAFIKELNPYSAIIMTWVDDHESLDPRLALERGKEREVIHQLLMTEAQTQRRWIVPPLEINFSRREIQRLRSKHDLTGPMWQHMDLFMELKADPLIRF